MENRKKIFYGTVAKEECHFFIYDKHDGKPVHIENIGYTPPNRDYCVSRKDNEYFVFEYVISGKGYLEINGSVYELGEGDVYCIEPGYDHTYYSDSKEPFEKIWINFFSDFFVEVFRALDISGKFVFKNTRCRHLFEEIKQLSETSAYSSKLCYAISPLLFQIACILAETAEGGRLSETASAIKQLLDGALFSNISMNEIASILHISKMQIMREFSKNFNGESPYNYLLTNKIKMAKQFLLNTNMSVNEISDKLAFSDPQYFSKLFKKKTGLSPLQYRKAKNS